MRAIDLTGQRFGQLTVIERVGTLKRSDGSHAEAKWRCQCDCGKGTIVIGNNLRKGNTRSCGHLWTQTMVKHGNGARGHRTPEYRAWAGIIDRCENSKSSVWKYYGGRGIGMCAEWRHDFPAFFAHAGLRPSSKHSIDRINNDGNYEPGNVRWATRTEQARNMRRHQRG